MQSEDGQAQCEGTDKGRKEETRVPSNQSPSAQAPSTVADHTGGADLSRAGSPTALDILAGSGAAAAAAEATQPNSQESLGNSMAIEILNLEDDEDESSSEEHEEESVQGTPTGVLCEQVVPLLRYLDRKVAKYGATSRFDGSQTEAATGGDLQSAKAERGNDKGKSTSGGLPLAGSPPEGAPSAKGPSGQETSGEPPSAQPPSAVDALGATPLAEAPPTIVPSAEAPPAQDLSQEQDLSKERT
ncbi:hypothetical protein AXG93_1207s1000 [Marchantia polymorpha subsp. ruderalis]|uniref:Uncharacterized protein n=1 Tax=Marchantia polymorpha subsp. ruderalis TaxID=1480154 RepID=A0A176VK70_MARPO|nr:hypothetical protein AXG93_1207s1000 [Marchantia polymorpha subsp. ruderalis]